MENKTQKINLEDLQKWGKTLGVDVFITRTNKSYFYQDGKLRVRGSGFDEAFDVSYCYGRGKRYNKYDRAIDNCYDFLMKIELGDFDKKYSMNYFGLKHSNRVRSAESAAKTFLAKFRRDRKKYEKTLAVPVGAVIPTRNETKTRKPATPVPAVFIPRKNIIDDLLLVCKYQNLVACIYDEQAKKLGCETVDRWPSWADGNFPTWLPLTDQIKWAKYADEHKNAILQTVETSDKTFRRVLKPIEN